MKKDTDKFKCPKCNITLGCYRSDNVKRYYKCVRCRYRLNVIISQAEKDKANNMKPEDYIILGSYLKDNDKERKPKG